MNPPRKPDDKLQKRYKLAMKTSETIRLYDQDQRNDIEYPDTRREVTPSIVRHVNTSGTGQGYVIYSQLREDNVEQEIGEQIRYFESQGQDFEWKVFSHDRPSDLKERLAAHGFTVEEEEAILVLDLEEAPSILWQPVAQSVRRIVDPEQVVDVCRVEEQVWNEDFSWLSRYLREALRVYPDQMSVYVAYVDEKPASAAWTYFPKRSRFASLWGGSTLEDFRKQGLYTALLAVRTQEARKRGIRFLTVDASPMSRPILEKFGFGLIAYSYPCKWKRET